MHLITLIIFMLGLVDFSVCFDFIVISFGLITALFWLKVFASFSAFLCFRPKCSAFTVEVYGNRGGFSR